MRDCRLKAEKTRASTSRQKYSSCPSAFLSERESSRHIIDCFYRTQFPSQTDPARERDEAKTISHFLGLWRLRNTILICNDIEPS
jgi:hypothetical protein